jgi:hypothetical protein
MNNYRNWKNTGKPITAEQLAEELAKVGVYEIERFPIVASIETQAPYGGLDVFASVPHHAGRNLNAAAHVATFERRLREMPTLRRTLPFPHRPQDRTATRRLTMRALRYTRGSRVPPYQRTSRCIRLRLPGRLR